MAKRTLWIEPKFTLLMADSAYQAYAILPPKPPKPVPVVIPPKGFSLVGHWSGKNPGIFYDTVEPYGVIFQNDNDKGEVIFSFRGTVTVADMEADIFVTSSLFKPYQNTTPRNVHVASGFKDIYSTPVTPGGSDSMQQQLMQWIDKLKPTSVLITGHSLGSALAEIFNLDLYVSFPERSFVTRHCNFACPRVGAESFASLYRDYEAGKRDADRTMRIVNWYDKIPCLPPQMLDFHHGPEYFLIAFYDTKNDTYVERHSMVNYWHVLQVVVNQPNQVFDGMVKGINDAPLRSIILTRFDTECSWLSDDVSDEPHQKKEDLSKRKGCLGFFGLF